VSFQFFSFSGFPFVVSRLFDPMSCSFSSVVLLISSMVMIYSYNYIIPYTKSKPFIPITVLFVLSMLVLVFFDRLFFVMLG
jgi:NADH:ubiquinone oxidoreductase subunit 5 (subunit L)/multisubunit Na+/H+ antiporter MnhA subunit